MELFFILDGLQDAVIQLGNGLSELFHHVFHVLTLGMAVGGTGAFNDGQCFDLRIVDNILVLTKDSGPNQGDILPVKVGYR